MKVKMYDLIKEKEIVAFEENIGVSTPVVPVYNRASTVGFVFLYDEMFDMIGIYKINIIDRVPILNDISDLEYVDANIFYNSEKDLFEFETYNKFKSWFGDRTGYTTDDYDSSFDKLINRVISRFQSLEK